LEENKMPVSISPGMGQVFRQGPSAMYQQWGAPSWLATLLGAVTPDPFTSPMGLGMIRGPRVKIPNALQRALGMGEEAAETTSQWTNLERPWSGIYKRGLQEGREVPSPSWQNPHIYNLDEVAEEGGGLLSRFLRQMGPPVDLNAPELTRNAEFFNRLGLGKRNPAQFGPVRMTPDPTGYNVEAPGGTSSEILDSALDWMRRHMQPGD
jgi:hypothetical protein